MSLIYANRVHEAASGSGSQNLTLLGALSGKATFTSKIQTGTLVPYVLLDGNGVDWEAGFGTLASATELQRTTVVDSSASSGRINSEEEGTPVKISLSTNQHEVFIAPNALNIFAKDEDGAIADPSAIRAALFVDTIAAMTALGGLIDGETVFVKGDASLGDALGACYRWDASDAGSESTPESYEHDSVATGLFKKVRYDIQGLVRSGTFEVDARAADTADTGGAELKLFFRKKATAATAWARVVADYVSSTVGRVRLGIRYAQASAEKFFIDAFSTGDNFDRVELLEPVVLPTRTNANGLKTRALAWLSGASRLALAQGDAAASGSAADYWEVPLTKGGYLAAAVETITALKAIDAAKFGVDGDKALVLGKTTLGDVPRFFVKWSSASTATADDWSVFRPSVGAAASGAGRWLRIDSNPIVTFTNSDATPSIANGDFFVTAGTPPAAITDFDDAFEGQAFVVQRGAADQTITHDATKIDLGGEDLELTATNPRAYFVHVNGIHRLIGSAATATGGFRNTFKAAGAVGDGVRGATGVATNGDATFTDINAAWSADDVGKPIVVQGAGSAGAALATTIASLNSSTSIELTVAPSTSVGSNAAYVYGTDDTAAIQGLIDSLGPAEVAIAEAGAIYCVSKLTLPNVTPATNYPVSIVAFGQYAQIVGIGGGDSGFLIAPTRWVTATKSEFPSSPLSFSNILFDASKLSDVTVVVKNWWSRFFDCWFTGGKVDQCILTRQNQDASDGSTGGYSSNCGWWRCVFNGAGSGAGFRNQGTASSNVDASTDGYLVDCTFPMNNVSAYGFHMGNTGGWTISGSHTYESTSRDFYIERLGNIGELSGVYEDLCTIKEIQGTLPVTIKGACNFWEGIEVLFAGDDVAETLILDNLVVTTSRAATAGQLTVNTSQSNKVLVLRNPSFRATTPIVRSSGGTIEVEGGRDGNGAMGRWLWDDSANPGPVHRSVRISASPAASDVLSRYTFEGSDSAGNVNVYAVIDAQIVDPTNGSEDGRLRLKPQIAGVETEMVRVDDDVTVFAPLTSQVTGGGQAGFNIFGEAATIADYRRYSADAFSPAIASYKARGSLASPAGVNQFDEMFRLTCGGYSSSAFRDAGYIRAFVWAASPSSTDMETVWRIEGCAAGSASITEMARFSHANGLAMFGANTVVDANRLFQNRVYTVATLPAGAAGKQCYASDLRVFNGAGTQEGAGVGTGGIVTHNGSAWKIAGTNVTAVA